LDRQSYDERLNARMEIAKSKNSRSKGRVTAFYLLFLLLITAVCVTLALTVFFHIEKIEIVGASPYSEEEIMAVSNIKIGENLFLAGTEDAKKRIEEKLPYIETAKIKRRLPSKISIDVTEAKESAAFKTEHDQYVIVSKNSKALSLKDDIPFGIALLEGFTLESHKIGQIVDFKNESDQKTLLDIINGFEKHRLEGVTRISIENSVNLSAIFENRIMIKFGAPVDLDNKLVFAKEYISSSLSGNDTGVLDVTNPARGYYNPSKTFEGMVVK